MSRLPNNSDAHSRQTVPSINRSTMTFANPLPPQNALGRQIIGNYPLGVALHPPIQSAPMAASQLFPTNSLNSGATSRLTMSSNALGIGSQVNAFNLTTQARQHAELEMLMSLHARKTRASNMNQASNEPHSTGLTASKKRTFNRYFLSQDRNNPKAKLSKQAKTKPCDMPRRALTAYNIFFSEQRKSILREIDLKESGKAATKPKEDAESEKPSVLKRTFFPTREKRAHRKVHGKIGLVALAKTISKRWKDLPLEQRKYYEELAREDKKRHKLAVAAYRKKKAADDQQALKQEQKDARNYQSIRTDSNIWNASIQGSLMSQQSGLMHQQETIPLTTCTFREKTHPRLSIFTAPPKNDAAGVPNYLRPSDTL